MTSLSKTPTAPKPAQFTLHVGDRTCVRSYQALFDIGHQLWKRQNYAEAHKVFERLATIADRGPRSHILLAHCKAMLGDYSGCSATLSGGLASNGFGSASSELHNAFVLWKCGMFGDVKQELEKVVNEHAELPTPCLLLADLLLMTGSRRGPFALLKKAIERDRPDGAVALVARHCLEELKAQRLKLRPSDRQP